MKKFLIAFIFILITNYLITNYSFAQTPTSTPTPTLTPRPTFQPTCSPSPVPPTATLTPTVPVSGISEVTILTIFGGAVFVLLGVLCYKTATS